MKKLIFTLESIILCAVILTCASLAHAQQRTFVSSTGNDANDCSRATPCRNFQRGHDAVAPGGEVVALDSAGYGQVTITKSVTITGEGVMAGITAASGTNGISIATAGITVNLRSLSIQGNGTGDHGINATDFTVLHLEKCIVNGFASDGIFVQSFAAGTRKVFIKDSIFRNNGGDGIALFNGGGSLIATVERTRAENNNSSGIAITGSGATVTARGCLSSGNANSGFYSSSGGVLNIENGVASSNGSDGIATAAGTVRVANSTVTNNTGYGFDIIGIGTFVSRENNTVRGNNGGGAQTFGTITPLAGT